jgi:hypothetical protein
MQSDIDHRGAARATFLQDFVREVQTGGGRGHRAFFTRENGLISFSVGRGIGPLDVRRQRDVPDLLELREQVGRTREADGALAEFTARDNLSFQVRSEADAFAHRQFAAGPHQCLPIAAIGAHGAQQEDFHVPAQEFSPLRVVLSHRQRVQPRAMPEEPGREDARIVEHQAIAGVEIFGEVAEEAIFPAAGAAVDH